MEVQQLNLGLAFLGLFILEIFVLSFISKKTHASLGRLLYSLTHSEKAMVNFLALIFLPGTLIHELSHGLMAGICLVHVGEIDLMPEARDGGIKLGSAQIGKTDPFRRALIGLAPVIFGIILLFGILFYLTYNLDQSLKIPYIVWAGIIYAVFVLTNTMFSSPKDLEGTLGVGVFALAVFLGLYLLGYNQIFSNINNFLEARSGFIQKANLLLLVPILVDLLILGLIKLLIPKRSY